MKIKNVLIAFAMLALSGCSSNFIDKPTTGANLTASAYYNSDDEMLAGTGFLYNIVWFDYNDKVSFVVGDGKGGVFTGNNNDWTSIYRFAVDPTNSAVLYAWQAFFNVIANANVTMYNIKTYTSSAVTDEAKKYSLAECYFMRGMAYYYLISNWGEGVPLISNNLNVLDSTITRNIPESVFEFIIRDLKYAADNLTEAPKQPGRLTKWAAKAALAKVYLARSGLGQSGTRSQADLDLAKQYAGEVCKNSGLTLMNYEDLFKTKYNTSKGNNTEGLFALQWVYGGVYGTSNTVQAQLAFNGQVTGTWDGWGIAHGASADVLKYYIAHPEDSVRRKATFFFPGETYNYVSYTLNNVVGPLTVPATNTGKANVKKYIVGQAADNDGQVGGMQTTINTYMLRLADVYLIYAEAILGNSASTSDADALTYFNAVRTRAGVSSLSSLTFKDIFNERRIEFAMEGQSWYDLVRLHYYDPAAVFQNIDTTDKGDYTIELIEGSSPKKWATTYTSATTPSTAFFTADEAHFSIPYPATEITRAPNLIKTPVAYDFSKYE